MASASTPSSSANCFPTRPPVRSRPCSTTSRSSRSTNTGSTSSPPIAGSSRLRRAAASTTPKRISSPGTTSSPIANPPSASRSTPRPGGALCPGEKRDFNPRLEAGTSNSQAGGFSDFHLKLDRDDGDQFLGDLNFTMPPGLTGSLRGLTYCSDAAIAAAAANQGRAEQASPSCPASSQLGTTNVAAGPGSHPFHAYGSMYLAGPLKGAPFSLVAITPALAGPYDYGVVVVRVAINVDPRDAHVVALSDTVPSIIGGVPIRMRSIQVNLDKPNFIINPTNCSPMSVDVAGHRRPGHRRRLLLLFPGGQLHQPAVPAEVCGQGSGTQEHQTELQPGAPLRPQHPPG